jgi:hypothetical protein
MNILFTSRSEKMTETEERVEWICSVEPNGTVFVKCQLFANDGAAVASLR